MKLANALSDRGLSYIVRTYTTRVRHIFPTGKMMLFECVHSLSTELQKKENKFSHDIEAEAI